jgi:hypothetical protein
MRIVVHGNGGRDREDDDGGVVVGLKGAFQFGPRA